MSFFQIQAVIFLSIFICSIVGGKKASFLASAVWIIQTMMTYRVSSINYLQIIILALSFQIGMLTAIIRDFILNRIRKISKN